MIKKREGCQNKYGRFDFPCFTNINFDYIYMYVQAKKHVPQQPGAPEGIMRKEMPIHYSNVMLLHPDTQ